MPSRAKRILSVVAIAFAQGAMEFHALSSFYYYKNVFRASASRVSLLQGFIYLPWALKPFMGALSDTCPLFGSRRKSYLLLATLCELLCLLGVGALPPCLPLVFALQLLASFSLVFRNVIGEAMVVEMSREDMLAHPARSPEQHQRHAQRAVSCFFGARALGSLVFSFLGGLALKVLTTSQVFFVCAGFSAALLALLALFYAEGPAPPAPASRAEALRSLRTVWRALAGGPVRWLLLVVCVAVANPGLATTLNFYYTEMLGFTPTQMGLVALCSSAAYLAGILLFNAALSELPFRALYIATSAAIGVFDLTALPLLFEWHRRLGAADLPYVLLTASFSSLLTEINFLPVLAVGCRICPPGLEATTYALFTALFNAAGYASTLLGSLLVFALDVQARHFRNLWALVVAHSLYALLVTAAMGAVDFRAAIAAPLPPAAPPEARDRVASAVAVSSCALELPPRLT